MSIFTYPTIILASRSQQRKKLLTASGYQFLIKPADIDEKTYRNPNLAQRAAEIALAKARKLADKTPQAIVLAADAFLSYEDQVFEKPATSAAAARMLKAFSSNSVQVLTGYCYIDPLLELVEANCVISWAVFRNLSDDEIRRYVESQPVTTWSGGYSPAYDAGANLLREIKGSLTGCTHGIPMEIMLPLLENSFRARNVPQSNKSPR